MKGSYFKEYSKALRSAAVQSLGGKCSKCGEMEKLRICSREPEKKNRQKLWREIATNPEVRSKFFLLCPKCNKSRVSNILKRPSFSTKVKWWVDALITGVYSPDDSFLDERFWNLLFELSGMTQGQFVKELKKINLKLLANPQKRPQPENLLSFVYSWFESQKSQQPSQKQAGKCAKCQDREAVYHLLYDFQSLKEVKEHLRDEKGQVNYYLLDQVPSYIRYSKHYQVNLKKVKYLSEILEQYPTLREQLQIEIQSN